MLTPFRTEKMVRALKEEIGLPVHVHCHYIGGMAPDELPQGASRRARTSSTPRWSRSRSATASPRSR